MIDRHVRQYKVRPNEARWLPVRALYFDTETKTKRVEGGEYHRMDMAWTCYVRRRPDKKGHQETWKFWNDTKPLCEYIDSLAKGKTVLYVFGHNLFFDLQASDFYYYFTKWGYVLRFTYDKGLTFILSIGKKGKHIKCLSTTNFYPMSLKKIGDMIGLEKLDVDFEKSTREELITYCKRDVEICKRAMEYWYEFVSFHDLGKFGMTRASQSFNAFRHKFMAKALCFHRDEELSAYEMKAYHGGRTECFERGKIEGGPFVSLDVNSMYPFVMKTREYPTRFVYFNEFPTPAKVERTLNDYCVVAKVWLRTDEPAYAVKRFKQTIFPVGTFSAYLCTEGLKYALERDHVLTVDSIAAYRKGYLFTSFVDFFYGLRQEYSKAGNTIMKRVAKDILNSLYGKFAQKSPVEETEDDMTFDGYWKEEIFDLTTGNVITVTKLFNKRFTQIGEKPGKNSLIPVSAHVTEYARFYLWKIIREIGLDRVLYCDTDSVKVRKQDMDRASKFMSETALGGLKVEEECETLTIDAAKQYHTEHTVKLKGVPASAEKVADNLYRYKEFTRQDTHLRKRFDRWFYVRDVEKDVTPRYTKGRTLNNGKVLPVELNENAPALLPDQLPLGLF